MTRSQEQQEVRDGHPQFAVCAQQDRFLSRVSARSNEQQSVRQPCLLQNRSPLISSLYHSICLEVASDTYPLPRGARRNQSLGVVSSLHTTKCEILEEWEEQRPQQPIACQRTSGKTTTDEKS